jgi:hypothetical protein
MAQPDLSPVPLRLLSPAATASAFSRNAPRFYVRPYRTWRLLDAS